MQNEIKQEEQTQETQRLPKRAVFIVLFLLIALATILAPLGFQLLTQGMLRTIAVYAPHKDRERDSRKEKDDLSWERRDAKKRILLAQMDKGKRIGGAKSDVAGGLYSAPTAVSVQQQQAEEFFNVGEGAESFLTIYNASYSKDTLQSCRQRCLLRIRDANGQSIPAVINGPEFATILSEHGGTINLIGKNRLVRNRNLFMVQNITFNLAPMQAKTVANPNSGKLRYSNARPQPRFGYEDLRDDLSR